MSDKYEILTIDPTWKREPEDMGSKRKFWYRESGEDERYWLFKYPKKNTGEHWAEKIAAEVAQFLRIKHAQVKLAVFENQPGSVTESFARGGRSLWHGNQILAGVVQEYDPKRTFGQSSHTLTNIWRALDTVYTEHEAAQRAKLNVAEYVVLDGLIGNTDRHHENWGILRKRVQNQWQGIFAPSFDHASSLGRELLDERRELLLTENRVGRYAEKGHGALYWSENEERRGPSPLELVRRATHDYPDIFHPALNKLEMLDKRSIWGMIDGVPDDWMTSLAKQFSHQLMIYNLNELRGLI